MVKTRYYVVASSLGAYFGLYQAYGNGPLDQLEIDLGNQEADFTELAVDRMDLGTKLEGPVLDYFENKLNIQITERNEEYIYAFDEALKGKIDGFTNYQGVPTGVECKVSASSSGSFTENIGYVMQCQAYMEAKNVDQWLLLGLYNGKPEFKVIKRDDSMISDIKEMVYTVSDILNGIKSKDDFPWHLVEKYTKQAKVQDFVPDATDEAIIEEYSSLKQYIAEFKQYEERLKELEDYLKSQYEGAYSTDKYVVTIGRTFRKGSIDLQQLAIDHPEIDIEKYRGPETSSKSIRYKKAKS